MGSDKVNKAIGYNLNIFKTILNTLGIISVVTTIILALILFEGIYLVIAIFSLATIIILTVAIQLYLHIRKISRLYNKQEKKLIKVTDNRDTLIKILEKNNSDMEQLKQNFHISQAQILLLFEFLQMENRPDTTIIQEALKIENHEVDNNDKHL